MKKTALKSVYPFERYNAIDRRTERKREREGEGHGRQTSNTSLFASEV